MHQGRRLQGLTGPLLGQMPRRQPDGQGSFHHDVVAKVALGTGECQAFLL
jgi:hypothetical protein